MGYFLVENWRKEVQRHCLRFQAFDAVQIRFSFFWDLRQLRLVGTDVSGHGIDLVFRGSYSASRPRRVNISGSLLPSSFEFWFIENRILKILGTWAQSVRNCHWKTKMVIWNR